MEKHLSGAGVAGCSAELRIYGSVLNILVAQPVFGKVDILAGVEDMGLSPLESRHAKRLSGLHLAPLLLPDRPWLAVRVGS